MWEKLIILFGNMIVVTPRYISTSPKRKLRNNTDVSDYFPDDNKTYHTHD